MEELIRQAKKNYDIQIKYSIGTTALGPEALKVIGYFTKQPPVFMTDPVDTSFLSITAIHKTGNLVEELYQTGEDYFETFDKHAISEFFQQLAQSETIV